MAFFSFHVFPTPDSVRGRTQTLSSTPGPVEFERKLPEVPLGHQIIDADIFLKPGKDLDTAPKSVFSVSFLASLKENFAAALKQFFMFLWNTKRTMHTIFPRTEIIISDGNNR